MREFTRQLLDPGSFAARYGFRGWLFWVAVAALIHTVY